MFTREEFEEIVNGLHKKINDTEITEDSFKEIKEEIWELVYKSSDVEKQILDAVKAVNELCNLYGSITSTANAIFSVLKKKKLLDAGVDLSDSMTSEKYSNRIISPLVSGTSYKVELKKSV